MTNTITNLEDIVALVKDLASKGVMYETCRRVAHDIIFNQDPDMDTYFALLDTVDEMIYEALRED